MSEEVRSALRRRMRPGCTIALADGVGSPTGLYADLSAVAASVPGTRLLLGWCPVTPANLDLSAFSDVRAFMPGPTLRHHVRDGTVRYVPAHLSQLPALLAGPWRPDLLVMSVCETRHGLALGSEASWIAAAARSARACLAELNTALPHAAPPTVLAGVDVEVVAASHRRPVALDHRPPDDTVARLGAEVARLVPEGAALQIGPGPLGDALVAALRQPVRVDSGIVTDAVVDLAARGLLRGEPLGTYLAGTEKLYAWAHGRSVLDGVEVTHDATRLASSGLVAVNTALQVDLLGQVALEGSARVPAAGVGGHTDYAYAASRSVDGLSVIALPSRRAGESTLVDRLTLPVATPRSVVDVVVTEHGHADLRGLTDEERAEAIAPLFP